MKLFYIIKLFCLTLFTTACIGESKENASSIGIYQTDDLGELDNTLTLKMSNSFFVDTLRKFKMCSCVPDDDTLYIEATFGIMNGNTLLMKIHENVFTTYVSKWGDSAGEHRVFYPIKQTLMIDKTEYRIDGIMKYEGVSNKELDMGQEEQTEFGNLKAIKIDINGSFHCSITEDVKSLKRYKRITNRY